MPKIFNNFITGLFTAFAVLWLFTCNRYHIIYFQESTQLFRTDIFYFNTYFSRPGGLVAYCASFLTQWYHYPLWGACIISLILSAVTGIKMLILRRYGKSQGFAFFPLAIGIFLLLACSDTEFRLVYPLSILLNLIVFYIYTFVPQAWKHYFTYLLILFAYFVSGGAFWLFVTLLVLNELSGSKKSWILIFAGSVFGLILPFFAHRFVYTATLNNVFFSFTPFSKKIENNYYQTVWLLIPILFFIFRILAQNCSALCGKLSSLKWTVPVTCIIIAGGFWGFRKETNRNDEIIEQLSYEAERRNWDKVITVSRNNQDKITDKNLNAYYMNLAYSEKGLLASNMFDFEQTGTCGLFVDWTLDFRKMFRNSELYYNLGIMPEAEHGAFESLVLSPNEHGSKMLRRLLFTNMLRKDDGGFEKYVKLFEKSPVYKKFAGEQRKIYASYKRENLPENIPVAGYFNDFFINHGMPEYNLIVLLRNDSTNRKAFEYLQASFILKKDLPVFKYVMDRFYGSLAYSQMPRHLEEALVAYMYAHNDQSVMQAYPVRRATVDRFIDFLEDQSQTGKTKDQLKRKYGDTFWYYYSNVQALALENSDGVSVY